MLCKAAQPMLLCTLVQDFSHWPHAACAQMLRNVDAGIRVVFECKDEDGSPLAGEASSLAMKVRGLRARTPPRQAVALRLNGVHMVSV